MNFGLMLHDWNWKFNQGYMGRWAYDYEYSFANVGRMFLKSAFSNYRGYELGFRHFNVNFGMRFAGYAFHQTVMVSARKNNVEFTSPAEIKFLRYAVSPVVGLSKRFKLLKNIYYQPGLNIMHNLRYIEPSYVDLKYKAVIYDSAYSYIREVPLSRNNFLDLDLFELNIQNTFIYKWKDRFNITLSVDWWKGFNVDIKYGNVYVASKYLTNYKYSGINFGLQYLL